MILDRQQFIDYWNNRKPGLGGPDSAVWIAERHRGFESQCFVSIHKSTKTTSLTGYWDWCNSTLSGRLLCYSSSSECEWWGFENPADAIIWSLRWQ